jgi:hypothetical protein
MEMSSNFTLVCNSKFYGNDRDLAQAVNRRLPTAAAWVRTLVRLCGICGGHSGAGVDFLRVLRFPLPILNSTGCFTRIIIIYHPGLVK